MNSFSSTAPGKNTLHYFSSPLPVYRVCITLASCPMQISSAMGKNNSHIEPFKEHRAAFGFRVVSTHDVFSPSMRVSSSPIPLDFSPPPTFRLRPSSTRWLGPTSTP